MVDVLIIGGGIAGCSLAYLLSERGYTVRLLEANVVGGLLREIEFDSGYYCDSAPHFLFFNESNTRESAVKSLFSKFSELTHDNYYAATFPRGALADPHHYPVSAANIDRWDDAEQLQSEFDTRNPSSSADNFEDYMIDTVGPTLYDRYFKSYTRKQWGVDPARITGDWFDFKISIPPDERDFFGDGAYYPTRKYSEILTEMVDKCTVVFDKATGIRDHNDKITGIKTESTGIHEANTYVSTIDPTLLSETTTEPLRYRSMVIVAVHIARDTDIFPAHVTWGYFPNDFDFTRITDYHFIDQSLPENESILTVEFPCFIDDVIWSRPTNWFKEYLEDVFEQQSVDISILEIQVRRVPRAYPLPVREEINRFERINGEISNYENMYNLGRISTYEYIWIKDIVAQANDTMNVIVEDNPM